MISQVLWALDNEIEGSKFERLCTDLLYREGYDQIVPIGGSHDHGRDAEIRIWKGISAVGAVTFFQYSLEDNWERKLERELEKVKNYNHALNAYVFVTSQKATGLKRDQLVDAVSKHYGWQLVIYDREWLRLRLEEAHPDLAAKYLGIVYSGPKLQMASPTIEQDSNEMAWILYRQGNYESAIIRFKDLLKNRKDNLHAWQALAWCQYSIFHYSDALVSIGQALAINEDNEYSLSLRASILTEDGIARGDRTKIILARSVFEKFASNSDNWVTHYNFGNALSALGENEKAKIEFQRALEINPGKAEIWKNLGSVYYHLHDHKAEIACYDKALAINGCLPQALISKGITLLSVFGKAKEAVELIEAGIKSDETLPNHWPHVWYWLGNAYVAQDNFAKALDNVRSGLQVDPHHLGLLRLKAILLANLWRSSSDYLSEAQSFFEQIALLPDGVYNWFSELIELYKATNQKNQALELVQKYLGTSEADISAYLEFTEKSDQEIWNSLRYVPVYHSYRKIKPVQEYINALKINEVSPDADLGIAILVSCIIPFGLAYEAARNGSKSQPSNVADKVFTSLFASHQALFPKLSKKLVTAVHKGSTEQIAKDLAAILILWPEVALREMSAEYGFIGGALGIPVDKLDARLTKKGQNLDDWQNRVRNATLFEINRELKIFREE